MPRSPLEPPCPRTHAPAGAATAVSAALLIALSGASAVACRGTDDAVRPTQAKVPEAPVRVAQAPAVQQPVVDAAPSGATASASHAEVEARLDRLLKAAQNCSGPEECRTVPVGGKACGGPTGYRAYSAKGADPGAVEALAREEHELAMAEARASGRVSNCMMLADPGAACVQGRCVTGGPGAPRGAVTR
jgi:hypothetical protein